MSILKFFKSKFRFSFWTNYDSGSGTGSFRFSPRIERRVRFRVFKRVPVPGENPRISTVGRGPRLVGTRKNAASRGAEKKTTKNVIVDRPRKTLERKHKKKKKTNAKRQRSRMGEKSCPSHPRYWPRGERSAAEKREKFRCCALVRATRSVRFVESLNVRHNTGNVDINSWYLPVSAVVALPPGCTPSHTIRAPRTSL